MPRLCGWRGNKFWKGLGIGILLSSLTFGAYAAVKTKEQKEQEELQKQAQKEADEAIKQLVDLLNQTILTTQTMKTEMEIVKRDLRQQAFILRAIDHKVEEIHEAITIIQKEREIH